MNILSIEENEVEKHFQTSNQTFENATKEMIFLENNFTRKYFPREKHFTANQMDP